MTNYLALVVLLIGTLEARTAVSSPTCNCGWKNQSRIVGGRATGVNEYPMMAELVDLHQGLVFCAGTIIDSEVILTAAHCLVNMTTNRVAVLVGDDDLPIATLHSVAKLIPHPSYNSDTQENDIALVIMSKRIVFNAKVGPVCLPFAYASTSFVGSMVQALGRGLLDFGRGRAGAFQELDLNLIPLSSCGQSFLQAITNQFCTYTEEEDACQFDSGGPILFQNPNSGRLIVIGVVSDEEFCATFTPFLNIRVGAYLDWILSMTPSVNYCRVE